MKIIGIGTDIVNIERIKKIYQKFEKSFLDKNFHFKEKEQFEKLPSSKKLNYLAKRFAAKEAVAKALGCGIGDKISFRDIAILNNELGAPFVLIEKDIINEINEYNIHISLSDDDPFAVAFIVISR